MKFNVSGKELYAALQAVGKVIAGKSAITILENIHLKVADGELLLTGSDSENVMVAKVPLADSEGEGEVLIKCKTLTEIVKEVANQPVSFAVNDDTKEVQLRYNNGEFKFVGTDATEYPRKKPMGEDVKEFLIPGNVLVDGLESTLFAVATDTIRPIMTGVYWDVEDERMTFVSSDTHKLVKYETTAFRPGVTTDFILSEKGCNVLKSLVEKDGENQVKVRRDDKGAVFEFQNITFSTVLILGKYPNYRRVFPEQNPFRLTVSRQEFLSAVRRVSIFASRASELTRYDVQPTQILVTSQDLDYSTSGEERVECDYQGNSMTIGFNSKYMAEVLANLHCDDVLVELSDPARPALFMPLHQDEQTQVVMLQMPMQVID